MEYLFSFTSRNFMLYADSKIRMGRNTKNRDSGVNSKLLIKDSDSISDSGTSNEPTITNNTVYGKRIFAASKFTPNAINIKVKMDKNTSRFIKSHKNVHCLVRRRN